MKKKLSISVTDIMHKTNFSQNGKGNNNDKKYSTPFLLNKAMRFQDLYKRAIGNQNYFQKIVNNSLEQSNIYENHHQSYKNTPINTQRMKKMKQTCSLNYSKKSQFSSQVSSLANSGKKTMPSSVPSHRLLEHCKQNVNYNPIKKKSIQKQIYECTPQKLTTKSKKSDQKELQLSRLNVKNQLGSTFYNCLKNLNHQIHCHLRDRNECFLSQNEIDKILLELGYNLECDKHCDFLKLLQVDIYGGTPSENLRQILTIIEGKTQSFSTKSITSKKLPKIINNNLKIIVNDESKATIANYFSSFKPSFGDEKENQGFFPNKLITNNWQSSFKKASQQKNYQQTQQTEQHFIYSSPNKKMSNPVRTQLIQTLSHSENKKLEKKQIYRQQSFGQIPTDNKIEQKIDDSQTIFQKVQKFTRELEREGEQDNCSRQLLREQQKQQININKQENDIVQLKNRLNQALKNSSLSPNHYVEESKQFSSFLSPNSYKYGNKPILSIDVNLGQGVSEKIIVFEGESAQEVAQRLSTKYTISQETKLKFQKILETHLSSILWKIDELSQQMLTDRTDSQT